MLPVRIQVRCEEGTYHNITYKSDGRLHFQSHTIKELQRSLDLRELGGKAWGCAEVLDNWRQAQIHRLPPELARFRSLQQTPEQIWCWRYAQRIHLKRKLKIADALLDQMIAKAVRVKKKDFVVAFVNAMATEVLRRKRALSLAGEPSKAHICVVDGVRLKALCSFKPGQNLVADAELITDGVTIPFYAHKVNRMNMRQAIEGMADAIDRYMVYYKGYRKIDEPTMQSRQKALAEARRLNSKIAGKYFAATDVSSGHTIVNGICIYCKTINGLTSAAAQIVLRKLKELDHLIRKMQLASHSRLHPGSVKMPDFIAADESIVQEILRRTNDV